jgi:hypothetical protein
MPASLRLPIASPYRDHILGGEWLGQSSLGVSQRLWGGMGWESFREGTEGMGLVEWLNGRVSA